MTPSSLAGAALTPHPGRRIDEIVARRAEERPHLTAVRCGDETVSYRELVDRADRIAATLTAAGIGPSDVVAVQLPRDIDMVCVVLGVLRAGAIYTLMPLDWPVDRRRDVLARTGSRLCVTRPDDRFDAATPMTSPRLLHAAPLDALPRADGHELGDLRDACCVFFTSGSTGQPKSAVAPHLGVIRVVFDPVLRFDRETVMLQAHSPAWDTFALELWGPLLHGGVTVLSESTYFSHDDLRAAVRLGVNTVFLTPTVFDDAVTGEPDCLAGLDTVVLGGERVSPAHLKAYLDRYPGATVFNIYGPVEATICVTVHHVTPDDDFGRDLPVGRPVPATSVHVVDASLVPVASGEVGEIVVAGDGIALGYLGDPAETATRFAVAPLGEHGADVRVYRTGDYGRIDAHGRLCFEGRRDRQVKILGLRVEPREVELAAMALDGVTSALAVPVPPEAPDMLGLVYTAPDGTGPEVVRQAVGAALPGPFVPKVIRRVDTLPRNANGKADLPAVAALLSTVAERAPVRVTPLTTVLAELTKLTGREATEDSDVIDLGLTSITALKLIGRINAVHGVRVPMRVVFRGRTPAAVAEWIAGR
ncbi:non-ribosomal peptide synthetase [Actinophytocola oryzae]|uniref:Amino acid adenylation domain-containing protein n=1 Tax=Actinophytocola oryzae TaxID=502181 RepID=A0A4R7VKT0_9PSEU|nr:non-ribosomal peptide synthetase [Actinophytocola oryzae]TDV49769.1 amino acid adenylation domain-containing protein [Actinophytocola oryzae]